MNPKSSPIDLIEATRVADKIIDRDAMKALVAPFTRTAEERFILYPHGVFLDPAQFDALSRTARALHEDWMFFFYLENVEDEPVAHRIEVGDIAYYERLTVPLDNALVSPTARWALLSFEEGFGLLGANHDAGPRIQRALSVDPDIALREFVKHRRETAVAIGDESSERQWFYDICVHMGYDRKALDEIWNYGGQ